MLLYSERVAPWHLWTKTAPHLSPHLDLLELINIPPSSGTIHSDFEETHYNLSVQTFHIHVAQAHRGLWLCYRRLDNYTWPRMTHTRDLLASCFMALCKTAVSFISKNMNGKIYKTRIWREEWNPMFYHLINLYELHSKYIIEVSHWVFWQEDSLNMVNIGGHCVWTLFFIPVVICSYLSYLTILICEYSLFHVLS